jgi:hypothetical protein
VTIPLWASLPILGGVAAFSVYRWIRGSISPRTALVGLLLPVAVAAVAIGKAVL